jgi:hypothetical protein
LFLQGKRRPFEDLSSSDYASQTDQGKIFEDDSDEQVETDDSPWEVSSSSEDDHSESGHPRIFVQRQSASSSTQQKESPGMKERSSLILLVQRPTTEMPRLLESIKFTVNCLYKIPIRRPAPIDRAKRNESLDTSCYQPFDILYVKDKFPRLNESVATRLGKMISRRRELLFYRLSHDQGLETAMMEPKQLQIAALVVNQLQANNDNQPEAPRQAVDEVARSQGATSRYTLHTKATTLRIDTPQVETPIGLEAPSVAESKSSMASSFASGNLQVEVPPRPRGNNGKSLDCFKCPYCLIIQSIKTDHTWKYVYETRNGKPFSKSLIGSTSSQTYNPMFAHIQNVTCRNIFLTAEMNGIITRSNDIERCGFVTSKVIHNL